MGIEINGFSEILLFAKAIYEIRSNRITQKIFRLDSGRH